MINMAAYGNSSCERCRFCGLDLPPDTVSVMAHYNTHWRQCNMDNVTNLSPCAFEPQLDIRIGPTPINPEDLEVSVHLEHHNFQYSYSPQTEPSNLSLTGTRCSPLNLTGRSKSESPLTSPLASPMPTENHVAAHSHQTAMNMNAPPQQPNHLQNMGLHSDMNIHHQYPNYNNGMYNNCHMPNHMLSSMAMNETLDMSCHNEGHSDLNVYDLAKKRKRPPEKELRCQACYRSFYTKASYDDHFRMYHSKIMDISNHNNFLMNSEPIDLNQSEQNVPEVMSCPIATTKPYKCSICDQEFMYKEELTEHANNHEASKPYRCDLCGTGLSHISALRRHILSHSGHKPHVCEVCSRGFFQKCDLLRHYATHGKKKDTQCNLCKKKYFSEYFLKNHKCKRPEDPKPFKCEICGNSCSTNIAWSYHMWKHTKNPIFIPFQSKVGTNKVLDTNLAEKNHLT
ncbi:UNVERIFIED_CONTAM: hypothetical protein RMT77_013329 [Armadillidium vulgare]